MSYHFQSWQCRLDLDQTLLQELPEPELVWVGQNHTCKYIVKRQTHHLVRYYSDLVIHVLYEIILSFDGYKIQVHEQTNKNMKYVVRMRYITGSILVRLLQVNPTWLT